MNTFEEEVYDVLRVTCLVKDANISTTVGRQIYRRVECDNT